jgi:glutaminyl-peptide cyclotransferase
MSDRMTLSSVAASPAKKKPAKPPPAMFLNLRGLTLIALFFGLVGAIVVWIGWFNTAGAGDDRVSKWRLSDIPVDGKSAHAYLVTLCDLGQRISGSEPMREQQELLTKHFEKLGAQVSLQKFDVRHPETGERTTLANMIVEWHPERKERLMICCHYDTRPFADEDPDSAKARTPGLFQGANDAAASVALFMELGKHIPKIETKYGIDFVFFDAEEFIYVPNRDKFFVGSEHFAQQYVAKPPAHRYKKAVLLDMVAGHNLSIFRELHSNRWRDTRPINDEFWGVAKRLQMREFVDRVRHEVRDDHLPLHNVAKIPCIDVIDFDYLDNRRRPLWHTAADTPDACSPLSMAKVGWVTLEWFKTAK